MLCCGLHRRSVIDSDPTSSIYFLHWPCSSPMFFPPVMLQPLLLLLLPFLSILLHSPTAYVASSSSGVYPLSSTRLGRHFDGIGGLSGGGATSRFLPSYPSPHREHILDLLFLPGLGASLQILKVEIGGDAQSTEGTEASHMHVEGEENYHRGYEWWLMREAKRRNPAIKLYGLSWGFPAWVAEGGSSPLTNSTASYITKWLTGARDVHGLHIDYVGIWNERSYSREYIHALSTHIRQANLTTQIIAAGQPLSRHRTHRTKRSSLAACDLHAVTQLTPHLFIFSSSDCFAVADAYESICDDMLKWTELQPLVRALGVHYPNSDAGRSCPAVPLPLWASEDFSSYYEAGGCWARLLNRNYVLGNMTATIAWNLISGPLLPNSHSPIPSLR